MSGALGWLVVPDPEVVEKAGRRRFTAKYQLQLLAEQAGPDGCAAETLGNAPGAAAEADP
ncbi:MAG: hypothetical protein IPN92_08050 [Chromatiaceae bacterium]|nr:hypothetical protein [Chromatiaceae bacterium]